MTFLDRLAAASLPLVPRPAVRRLSRRYIAGEERAPAVELGARLAATGYRVTYDVLGEAVRDWQGVDRAVGEYRALLAELQGRGQEVNLSVKPTHMGLLLDEDRCFETVQELAAAIARAGGFMRLESEDAPTLDATLRVFGRLRERFEGSVGCVLQSRLFRAEEDGRRLAAAPQPLNVRLVKGVYVEPPEIAWTKDADISASFRTILRQLLEDGAFVGVATHDEKLTRALQDGLQEQPEWRPRVEVQMLLGVREDLRTRVRDAGLPVRVYIPYGRDWYPYVLRRLRSNPALARYALMGLFRKREKLEADPHSAAD